jgi:hypothetical protein
MLGTMRAVAQAARTWPDRRKLLVLVGGGGFGSLVEREDFDAAVELQPDVMNVIRELQRANVTVYEFPAGILAPGNGGPPGIFADHTGGWKAFPVNASWLRVPQMFVENNSYYMLGITPSTRPSRSGFHPVRVRVNRPDLTVIARSSYYDGPEQPAPITVPVPDTPLDRAMYGVVPKTDLPLTLTSAPFRVPGSRTATVAVIGGLDRPAVVAGLETAEVAVRAFDERSPLRESKGHWTSTVRLHPLATTSGEVHYDAVTRLDLPPGRYEIRLSMQGADGVAGGVAQFLTVPDFETERLSLSGVVLGRPAARQGDHVMSGILPFAPTTLRTFAAREAVTTLVRVYQGGRSRPLPVSIATRIANADDEPVFGRVEDLPSSAFLPFTRTAEYRRALPLADLVSGEYLLTFEASLDGRRAQRHVRFIVK